MTGSAPLSMTPEAAGLVMTEGEILVEVMKVIAGHRRRVAGSDPTRLRREGVPDRGATAIDVRGAFDLQRGGGNAPPESVGKLGASGTRHADDRR